MQNEILPLLVLVDDHQAIGHTGVGLWQIGGVLNGESAQPQQVFATGLGKVLGDVYKRQEQGERPLDDRTVLVVSVRRIPKEPV